MSQPHLALGMISEEIDNLEQLRVAKALYEKCGLKLTGFKIATESHDYTACTFRLNESKIIFRTAKITPAKTGQFVTIWKRSNTGITEPFDVSDAFDFMIISTFKEGNLGQF